MLLQQGEGHAPIPVHQLVLLKFEGFAFAGEIIKLAAGDGILDDLLDCAIEIHHGDQGTL